MVGTLLYDRVTIIMGWYDGENGGKIRCKKGPKKGLFYSLFYGLFCMIDWFVVGRRDSLTE